MDSLIKIVVFKIRGCNFQALAQKGRRMLSVIWGEPSSQWLLKLFKHYEAESYKEIYIITNLSHNPQGHVISNKITTKVHFSTFSLNEGLRLY